MPTRLYYFKTEKELLEWCRERGYSIAACRKAWVGPGYYYARSKRHISIHIPELDKRRDPPDRKRVGEGPWRHVTDVVKKAVKLARATKKGVEKRAEKLAKEARKRGARKASKKTAQMFLLKRAAERSKQLIDAETKRLAAYLWERIPRKYRRGRNKVWTYVAVLALAKTIVRRAREKGVDPRSIDWAAEIDWRAGYNTAKQYVQRLLGSREISTKDVDEYMKWLERSARSEVPEEIDEWELKQLF